MNLVSGLKLVQELTLRATLGIEGPDIVIDSSWWLLKYVLVEGLSVE